MISKTSLMGVATSVNMKMQYSQVYLKPKSK